MLKKIRKNFGDFIVEYAPPVVKRCYIKKKLNKLFKEGLIILNFKVYETLELIGIVCFLLHKGLNVEFIAKSLDVSEAYVDEIFYFVKDMT